MGKFHQDIQQQNKYHFRVSVHYLSICPYQSDTFCCETVTPPCSFGDKSKVQQPVQHGENSKKSQTINE